MCSNRKVILFDLDGTIIYSKDAIFEAINYPLKKRGHKEFTERELVQNIRIPLKEKYRNKTSEDPEKFFSDFKNHYLKIYKNSTYIFPGMRELLEEVSNSNIDCAIVSLKTDMEVEEVLKGMSISLFFRGIFGSENEEYKPKPSPEHINYAIGRMGGSKKDCIVIGDMKGDIVSAKKAGCPAIGVSWSLRSRDELLSYGADDVADTPEDLRGILIKRGFLKIQ